MVNSPSDAKIIEFCQESPNFGKGMTVKFRENGPKQGTILLCKLGGQFQ